MRVGAASCEPGAERFGAHLGPIGALQRSVNSGEMPAFLAPTPRARSFDAYNAPETWETNAGGEIRCAP